MVGQWGNWQRGGGKGDKPKEITRPSDKIAVANTDELKARKAATKAELERRRARAQQRQQEKKSS